MPLIRSKTATIYYEEYGSGETLILLPGLLGTIESNWRRLIPDFAEYFHVVAVDLRGHGKTNNPSHELRLHHLVTDLFSLYETLEIDKARICGHSLGGYVGLAFGVQNPGTVESLMMHGTKFYWNTEAVRSAIRDLDAGRIVENVPQWAEQLQREHAPANGLTGWRTLLRPKSSSRPCPPKGLPHTRSSLRIFQSWFLPAIKMSSYRSPKSRDLRALFHMVCLISFPTRRIRCRKLIRRLSWTLRIPSSMLPTAKVSKFYVDFFPSSSNLVATFFRRNT
jgi:pimeloyl-ACP methyl ester carboxylesterase